MQEPRQILPGSAKKGAPGATLMAKTSGAETIEVSVVLVRKNAVVHDDIQKHVLMKPHERPNVDHTAFAERYGASSDAITAVQSFAARYGLRVTNVDQRRRVIKLSGCVSDMEAAFGTTLYDYAARGRKYRGRQGPLIIPAAIAGHVEAVMGLDNRPIAKPRLRSRAAQAAYFPNELAKMYKFPPGDGSGQTIALIELGGNYDTNDLSTYFAEAGLTKSPSVQAVSISQGVPVPYGQDVNSDTEVMLDIEVAGAMAPGATIIVYFAENTDQGFYEAVSEAAHHPSTTAVSISWGSPEKDWTEQSMDAWSSLGQSASLLNVPIFVAAGDHGCTDEEPSDTGYDGQLHVDFPGTCANGVASCGGTSIQVAAGAITNETVWNEGDGWATGGGASTHFQIPSWQNGISADGHTHLLMRGVPDIAGDADSNTGIKIRVEGADSVSGGTSAVAPQWAALTAILSQNLKRNAGFFIPLLYANGKSEATNDVTSGNNSVFGVNGFTSRAGWDACTGLGSPDGAKLLSLLSGSSSTVVAGPIAGSTSPTAPTLLPGSPSGGGSVPAGGVSNRTSKPFDPVAAVLYGQFVQAAYTMYGNAPNNPTPPQSSDFLPGYRLSAWVQMQDFIIGSTGLKFYGFIAQSLADPNQFVLAIRGTSNAVEWWDDANAAIKIPFKDPGCGLVGSGFAHIYDTLEVVECRTSASGAVAAVRSLKPVGGFAQQVSTLVQRHAAANARVPGLPQTSNVAITGHSLGSALATLYAMDNARNNVVQNPLICTFASPRVGDATFVAAFNALGLTSWRVVNRPDLVPQLPPTSFGFSDIDTLQQFDSTGKVKPSLGCWHALATYLSLIDPTLPPDSTCAVTTTAAAKSDVVQSSSTSFSLPGGAVTININIGARDSA